MADNDLLVKAKPQLNVKEFQDLYLRKNFENLKKYFSTENQLLGFQFFELNFTAASANQKVAHGLGVVPQDIISTRMTGAGILTFNWGLFDDKSLDITVTGPCRVRFFVGSYWNFNSTVNNTDQDTQQFSSILQTKSDTSSTFTALASPIVQNYSLALTDANKVLTFNPFLKNLQVAMPPTVNAVGKGIFILQKIDTSFNSVTLTAQVGESFDGLSNTIGLNSYKDTLKLIAIPGQWIVIDRVYSRLYLDLGWTSLQLTTNGLLNPVTLTGSTTLPVQLSGKWRRDGQWIETLFGFRNGTGSGSATGTAGPISLPLPGVTVVAGQNPVIGPLRWDQNAQPRDVSLGSWNGTIQTFLGGAFQGNENAALQSDFYFQVQNRGGATYYTLANIGLGFAMEGKAFFPVLGWGA